MAYSIAPSRTSGVLSLDARSLAEHQPRTAKDDSESAHFSWGHLASPEGQDVDGGRARPSSKQSLGSSVFKRNTPFREHLGDCHHLPATRSTSTSIDGRTTALHLLEVGEERQTLRKERKAEVFLSFENARKKLRQLGIASEVEWNYMITEPGKLPAGIPVNPEVVYFREWISMTHWLSAKHETCSVLWLFKGAAERDSQALAVSSAARFRKHPHPLVGDVCIKREPWHCSYCYKTFPPDNPKVVGELTDCAMSGRRLKGLLPRFVCSTGCEYLLCKACKEKHCQMLAQDELTVHLHKVVGLNIRDQGHFREAVCRFEFLGKVQEMISTRDQGAFQTCRFITNSFEETTISEWANSEVSPGDRLSRRSLKLNPKTRGTLQELFNSSNSSIHSSNGTHNTCTGANSSDDSLAAAELTGDTESREDFVGTLKATVLQNTLRQKVLGVAEVQIYRGMIPFKKWIDIYCPEEHKKNGRIQAEVIFMPCNGPESAASWSEGGDSVHLSRSASDLPLTRDSNNVDDAETFGLKEKDEEQQSIVPEDQAPQDLARDPHQTEQFGAAPEDPRVADRSLGSDGHNNTHTPKVKQATSLMMDAEQAAVRVQRPCRLLKYAKGGMGSVHERKACVLVDRKTGAVLLKWGAREPQVIENVVDGPTKLVKNRWQVPFNEPHHFTLTLRPKGEVVLKAKDQDQARVWTAGVEWLLSTRSKEQASHS